MRVLISANGPTWDAIVAPAFDTAPYWLLVDSDTNTLEALSGDNRPALSSLAVAAVITGHVHADTATQAVHANIPVYTIPAGGIRIAYDQWKRGRIKLIIAE